jgi:hypothetical protein
MRLLPLLCLCGLAAAFAHAASDLRESHLQLERWLDERHAATSLLQVGASASASTSASDASDASVGIRLARSRSADLQAVSAADPPLALRAMKRLEAYRERPAFPAFLETYMEERVNANVQFDVVAFAARRHQGGRAAAAADGIHIPAARARAADEAKISRSITYARADGSSRTCAVSSHGPGSYANSDRKTVAGDACAKSFAYKGKTYTGACTSVDIKRGEWCYLPKGAKNWGMCAEASFPMPFWEASTAAGGARFKEAPATRKLGRARDASSVLLEADAGTTKKNKGKKGDSDSVRATDAEALKWTTGEKTLLIVFTDHASLPGITADQAADLTGKISDFLSSNNNGQISINATVGTTIYRPQMELGLAANKADKPSADVFLGEVTMSLARGDTSGDYDADQVQFQCEVKLSSP